MADSLAVLEDLGAKAHKVLNEFFAQPVDDHSPQLEKAARLSMSLIGRWSSAEATRNAQNRMTITLGQRITKNPEELQNYLQITMPGSQWSDAISAVVEARRQALNKPESYQPA